MRRDELELLSFVRSVLIKDEAADVEGGTLLFQEGLINSINILALIGYVENRLGRRLSDEEIVMSRFESVKSITTSFFSQHP